MGAAKQSGAGRRIQALRPAQTRTAERNLGTRSTKIESDSFRIATFRKALIKLDSQLPQRHGLLCLRYLSEITNPKSLSDQNIAAGKSTQPSSVPESRFTQKAFAFGRGDEQRSLLSRSWTTAKWGLNPVIFVPSRAFRADI